MMLFVELGEVNPVAHCFAHSGLVGPEAIGRELEASRDGFGKVFGEISREAFTPLANGRHQQELGI